MAFGNKMGVKIEHNVDPRDFFGAGWGNIVCEVAEGKVGELSIHTYFIWRSNRQGVFEYGNTTITMDDFSKLDEDLRGRIPNCYRQRKTGEAQKIEEKLYDTDTILHLRLKAGTAGSIYPCIPEFSLQSTTAQAF